MLDYLRGLCYLDHLLDLKISEFDVIAKDIESKYDEHERRRFFNRKRERKVGAGRPFKLKVKERFLILFSVL